MTAEITQKKYMDIGIKRFKWSTSKDVRVRDTHMLKHYFAPHQFAIPTLQNYKVTSTKANKRAITLNLAKQSLPSVYQYSSTSYAIGYPLTGGKK